MDANKQKRSERRQTPIFVICGLILFFLFSYLFSTQQAFAANTPAVITYQGKLLANNQLVTTTQDIYLIFYDSLSGGSVLYTVSGTVGSPLPVSTTPTQGLFSINLGDTGTNSLDPAIFRDNASIYLEVRVGSEILSPRKRITAAPYAFNAKYLDGIGVSVVSSTTYIPISDASGNFTFNSATITTSTIGNFTVTNTLSLPANSIGANEIATTSIISGTYGVATSVPVFTVDADGRLTYATNTLISINANQITAGALTANRGGTGQDSSGWTGFIKTTAGVWSTSTITTSDISGLGTLALQNSSSVSITGGAISNITLSNLVSPLAASDGGTGQNSSGWNGVAVINSGVWSASSTLSVSVGGTGSSTIGSAGSIAYSNGSSYLFTAVGTSGYLLQSTGSGAPVWVSTSSLGLDTGSGIILSGNTGQIPYYAANSTTTLTATSAIFISTNGYIGVNTSTPDQILTVSGNINISNSGVLMLNGSNISQFFIASAGTSGQLWQSDGSGAGQWVNTSSLGFPLVNSGLAGQISYYAADGTTLSPTSTIFLANGYVGIGTSSPLSLLDIYGDLILEGTNRYLNFGNTAGSSGYGFYDNGGSIQFKNSGGSWTDIGTGTVGSGSTGQIPYYSGSGTTLTATSAIFISANGNVGIGTTSPAQKLDVVGNISNITHSNTPISLIATTSVGGNSPYSIYVSGRYAYTANYDSNTISVVDISNPSAPTLIATATVENGPISIYISGRYAYTANYDSNTISVIDISNPSTPALVATTTVGGNPSSIYISGRYAYTANRLSNTISVIDIFNPLAPIQIAVTDVGGLSPKSIYISGRYAYTANYDSNTISVIDISNPSTPALVATTTVGGNPSSIYISGRYAYMTDYDNIISVIDISNPSTPALVATTTVGENPSSIYVSGRYAYTANYYTSNNISVVDIFNPLTPVQIASTSVGGRPVSIFVSGRYVYVTNADSNTISVIDISGTEVTSLIAHSAEVGNIQSRNDIFAQGNIIAGTSLLVGAGGILSNGAVGIFASSTGATSSIFSIASGQTANIMDVLPNGNIGIGTSSPLAKFTIQDGSFLAAGSTGATPVSGAGYRMMWVPSKAAFRAGIVGYSGLKGDAWDDANIGLGSFAFGANTVASGLISFAGGYDAVASSSASFAFGTSVTSSGSNSVVFGGNSVASGISSFVFGSNSIASGDNSFAFGSNAISSNSGSFAFGSNVTNTVANSLAVGFGSGIPALFVKSGGVGIATTSWDNYKLMVDAGTSTAKGIGVEGKINATGAITQDTSLDLAEKYPINPGCQISGTCPEAGDVVCLASNNPNLIIEKCSLGGNNNPVGVISTNPGFLLEGGLDDYNSRKVTLAGRVPVKVTNINGNIHLGDKLTLSDAPGIAMKANAEGPTIGIALADYASAETGAILVATNIGWNNRLYRGFTIDTDSQTLALGNTSTPYNLILSGNLTMNNPIINKLSFSTSTLLESNVDNSASARAFILNASNFTADNNDRYILSLRSNNTPVFSVAQNGDVNALGNYYGASAILGTSTNPGDLAEKVDIAIDDNVESGDVVVVDPSSPDTYRRSVKAYEQSVAGVISTNPTIIVGNGKTDYTAIMAMVGRVPIKVTNANGSIKRGDLLITAPIAGYAMRYDPATDNNNRIVGIIGVALENQEQNNNGKILALIRTGWIYNRDSTINDIQNYLNQIAASQGLNLSPGNNPRDLGVNGEGDNRLVYTNGNLDLQGNSIVNISSIQSISNRWRIDQWGNLIARVQTADGASKEMYTIQSPNYEEFVFSSSSQLVAGQAAIAFDSAIKDIIDFSQPLKVSVTLTSGAGNGVYVDSKSENGFVVKELNNGTSNATFDWIVVAKRKANESTPPSGGQLLPPGGEAPGLAQPPNAGSSTPPEGPDVQNPGGNASDTVSTTIETPPETPPEAPPEIPPAPPDGDDSSSSSP